MTVFTNHVGCPRAPSLCSNTPAKIIWYSKDDELAQVECWTSIQWQDITIVPGIHWTVYKMLEIRNKLLTTISRRHIKKISFILQL